MIKYLSIIAVIFFLYLLFSSTVHAKTNNGISIIRDELRAQGLNESEVEVMMRISFCESSYRIDAKNSQSSASGLFGLLDSTYLAHSKYPIEEKNDWLANLLAATDLFKKEGTRPWAASSKCWSK